MTRIVEMGRQLPTAEQLAQFGDFAYGPITDSGPVSVGQDSPRSTVTEDTPPFTVTVAEGTPSAPKTALWAPELILDDTACDDLTKLPVGVVDYSFYLSTSHPILGKKYVAEWMDGLKEAELPATMANWHTREQVAESAGLLILNSYALMTAPAGDRQRVHRNMDVLTRPLIVLANELRRPVFTLNRLRDPDVRRSPHIPVGRNKEQAVNIMKYHLERQAAVLVPAQGEQ